MSDNSDISDKDSYSAKDEDFNPEDYQDEIESNESFNELNDDNAIKHSEDDENESLSESQSKSENEDTGPVVPGHRFDKKLVCVKYPGNVINPERALETLGGIAEISSTATAKNRRMELRFRPDDGYCKPACGDRHQTTAFLLRIRIKKSRREKVEAQSQINNKMENENNEKNVYGNSSSHNDKTKNNEEINGLANNISNCSIESNKLLAENNENNKNSNSGENKLPTFDPNKYENLSNDTEYELPKLKVLGRVNTEFRFTSLCDFQYLPIAKSKDDPTKDEFIYDSIYPVGIPPYKWMKKDVPLFLPPAAFSRMDTVQQYIPKTEAPNNDVHYVIGKTRKRRAGFSNFINFNSEYVPVNPPKGIETAMKVKFIQASHLEKMRKAFADRPIWSKNALMYITKFTNDQMKILLPSVAYYFMTGPWRITWVRLGYDPRKDPEAKKYQILDYRLKAMHGLHSSITCKRNYSEYTLPYRSSSISKPKAMVLMSSADQVQSQKKVKLMDENVYIYRPGIIPPSRQMFYQYCDVHVKEIQDMMDKYVGPAPGTPCHEKLGWLPVGFDDLCREIINKQVRAELRRIMNIPENHPTTLPRKRKLEPSGKKRKRYYKKSKAKQQKIDSKAQAAVSTVKNKDENAENAESNDDEWEDVLEGIDLSSTEEYNEDKNTDKNDSDDDSDYDNDNVEDEDN